MTINIIVWIISNTIITITNHDIYHFSHHLFAYTPLTHCTCSPCTYFTWKLILRLYCVINIQHMKVWYLSFFYAYIYCCYASFSPTAFYMIIANLNTCKVCLPILDDVCSVEGCKQTDDEKNDKYRDW